MRNDENRIKINQTNEKAKIRKNLTIVEPSAVDINESNANSPRIIQHHHHFIEMMDVMNHRNHHTLQTVPVFLQDEQHEQEQEQELIMEIENNVVETENSDDESLTSLLELSSTGIILSSTKITTAASTTISRPSSANAEAATAKH